MDDLLPAPTFAVAADGASFVLSHVCRNVVSDGHGGREVLDIPSSVRLGTPADKWTVTSIEPLSVHPSISCTLCDLSGWISGGSWVPE